MIISTGYASICFTQNTVSTNVGTPITLHSQNRVRIISNYICTSHSSAIDITPKCSPILCHNVSSIPMAPQRNALMYGNISCDNTLYAEV